MRLRSRLARLERRRASGSEDLGPAVEFWLAYNGRCDPPGRYPCPGTNVVLVIYQPEEIAVGEADP